MKPTDKPLTQDQLEQLEARRQKQTKQIVTDDFVDSANDRISAGYNAIVNARRANKIDRALAAGVDVIAQSKDGKPWYKSATIRTQLAVLLSLVIGLVTDELQKNPNLAVGIAAFSAIATMIIRTWTREPLRRKTRNN